jgi:hypothetical protein
MPSDVAGLGEILAIRKENAKMTSHLYGDNPLEIAILALATPVCTGAWMKVLHVKTFNSLQQKEAIGSTKAM